MKRKKKNLKILKGPEKAIKCACVCVFFTVLLNLIYLNFVEKARKISTLTKNPFHDLFYIIIRKGNNT